MKLTITKRIAKQGGNLVLIIPKNIRSYLEQGDLVELTIQKLEDKK
jgi:antitoxin component of MazEF toxin-antitoxin module